MDKNIEIILTKDLVLELGLEKIAVITADMLNGYTCIGDGAFFSCLSLTSIEIPNSVTSIGEDAFYGCSSLTSVTIPNSVTSIGSSAFDGCTGLTSVHISDIAAWCAISFGDNPLYYAHNLYLNGELVTNLVIPNSVTSIGESAFRGCSSLTSVTIPNSVTSIGYMAFWYCSGLTSIEIPDSVTSIGSYAFSGCIGLTSVTIGNSVTYIGIRAFEDCTGLTSVVWDAKDCSTSGGFGSQVTSFVFGNGVETIPAYCCSGMNITSITIPNSVTSIRDNAFYDCSSLTSPVYNAHVFAFMPTSYSGAFTIPDGIESITGAAFYGCTGLTSVTIPNSVTSIGESAFDGCTGLTSVTIPNSVTSIRWGAFRGCTGLTSVTIGDKTYKKQTVTNGKCKAYKAFNVNMTCRDFQYEEGKTYELDGKPKLCECGFHACLNLADVFNYYWGKIGKDVLVYEVELEGVTDERRECESKVVAKKITIGKRIL